MEIDNKLYKTSKILYYIPTIMDNPQIFKTIESVRKAFEFVKIVSANIVTWIDCCSDEYAKRVEEVSDLCIRSNKLLGGTRPMGFVSLYLDYDYIVISTDDYVIPEDYFQRILWFFKIPKLGIVGQIPRAQKYCELNQWYFANEKNLPDCPLLVRKEVIDTAGGICPKFSNIGYQIYELEDRALKFGWIVIGTNMDIKHEGHLAMEVLPKEFIDSEMSVSMKQWIPREKWWK